MAATVPCKDNALRWGTELITRNMGKIRYLMGTACQKVAADMISVTRKFLCGRMLLMAVWWETAMRNGMEVFSYLAVRMDLHGSLREYW